MNRYKSYNHLRATLSLAQASFRSITRSPSAIVFSLAFPLVFIFVFGLIGDTSISINVGIQPPIQELDPVYQALHRNTMIHIKQQNNESLKSDLEQGKLDAIITYNKYKYQMPYTLTVQYTQASLDKGSILKSFLQNIIYQINEMDKKASSKVVTLSESIVHGRAHKIIDFILPGQLGFSLLSSGVFGTAFVFSSLRLTQVIKRFFATPVKHYSIILGETIARMGFSLIGALCIILVGHFAFDFTLVHGFVTLINMLILSIIGLIIFMGFGFIISGIAKNESSIPPLANIITLPQLLLSGTFFSTDLFPHWLQSISSILPLTYFNEAMRKVAFEGLGLLAIHHQLLILALWGCIIYTVAFRVFKWE